MERIIELYKAGWQKYACFEGRACRAEIWAFSVINSLIEFIIILLATIGVIILGPDNLSSIILLVYFIALIFFCAIFIPTLAIVVRRLHDLNKSGWLYLVVIALGFVPFVGVIVGLVFSIAIFFVQGTDYSNQYGPESDLY